LPQDRKINATLRLLFESQSFHTIIFLPAYAYTRYHQNQEWHRSRFNFALSIPPFCSNERHKTISFAFSAPFGALEPIHAYGLAHVFASGGTALHAFGHGKYRAGIFPYLCAAPKTPLF
jgi:hypothetical protein